MMLRLLAAASVGALALAAVSAAQAREPYDELFFVRQHAQAADLYQDRASCREAALHMSDAEAAYSNPEYGALSAMGSALDEDALHEGGLHKRLERAVFVHCMEKKDWVAATPTDADLRVLLRANLHHPEALNAWLTAHEPPPAAPTPPAAPVVKTEAVAPAASPASSTSTRKTAN
jgi:hypothetical protein